MYVPVLRLRLAPGQAVRMVDQLREDHNAHLNAEQQDEWRETTALRISTSSTLSPGECRVEAGRHLAQGAAAHAGPDLHNLASDGILNGHAGTARTGPNAEALGPDAATQAPTTDLEAATTTDLEAPC